MAERAKQLKLLWTDERVQKLIQFYSENVIILSKLKMDKPMIAERLEKLRVTLEKEFTVKEIINKFIKIRIVYAKQKRLVNESKMNGKTFIPKYKYFSLLDSFLSDIVKTGGTLAQEEEIIVQCIPEQVEPEMEIVMEYIEGQNEPSEEQIVMEFTLPEEEIVVPEIDVPEQIQPVDEIAVESVQEPNIDPKAWTFRDESLVIGFYAEHALLWNVKHAEYQSKNRTSVLDDIVRELDLRFSVKEIILKFNRMRSTFMDNVRKVKNSKKSGSGTDQIYTPTYEHYDELLFLLGNDEPRPGVSSTNLGSLRENIPPKNNSTKRNSKEYSSYFERAIEALNEPVTQDETAGMIVIMENRLRSHTAERRMELFMDFLERSKH